MLDSVPGALFCRYLLLKPVEWDAEAVSLSIAMVLCCSQSISRSFRLFLGGLWPRQEILRRAIRIIRRQFRRPA